ncbi:MAG: TIGR02301 family protein [Notoacmeibacter sp.]|nr:TIGR02301 family protein [Notoacmeibacter sp.]
MTHRLLPVLAALALALGVAAPARAQTAPYEEKILRLSELIGALHYLRNLCGETGNDWRVRMEDLLAAEKPEGERRKRFVAAFNRGYRSFASVHTSCTPTSMEAIRLYMKEGEALSREIVVRYGG